MGGYLEKKADQLMKNIFIGAIQMIQKCITIAYDKDSSLFLGINTFGIRMRHEIFDKWLTEKRDVNYVIEFFS